MNKLAKNNQVKKSPYPFPHYGEIYLVYFNPRKGREVGKLRPSLVVSNNIQNEYDHHIIVAPLSDEDWETLAEVKTFEIPIKANATNGLDKDSKVLLNRLRGYCGVVSEEIIKQVDQGLELVLNLRKVL